MHVICMSENISNDEFWKMTMVEIEHRLRYQRRKKQINNLDLAYNIGCFVMNDKANDTYKSILSDILGKKRSDVAKNDIKRYKMICQRLGLKYPGERVT